jgi:peptidoglycan/LPS O-acetylase OafA/YrhL
MMRRSNKIDMLRGLLFGLMVSSHALTLARGSDSHWFYSDLWLPKGWATVVFVIVSGYGVGLLYSGRRLESGRTRLRHRCLELLAVMFASNAAFSLLRDLGAGGIGTVASGHWWLGMLTQETKWTISGVLLPTALVMLCGASVIRWTEKSPWPTLAALVLARIAASMATIQLSGMHDVGPTARFLFQSGYGGYPVIPFVINGCIGIWLGVLRASAKSEWKGVMIALLLLQAGFYVAFCTIPTSFVTQFLTTLSPLGKFAWMFLVAHQVERFAPAVLARAIEMIGQFALGSFVMHRIFIQLLAFGVAARALQWASFELRYTLLVCGTLLLTWGLCYLRQRVKVVDAPFRRLAL